ncbi:zf-UBP-domain-containing protein [Umbelopsis sp. PMI_123]|nr:zf-UBP-domain-containing protein [Umbelopsis sp. PMI_123]
MQLYRLKIQLFRSNPPVNLPLDLFSTLPPNLGPDLIAQNQSKPQPNRRLSHTKSRSQRQATKLENHPEIPPTPLPSKKEDADRNLRDRDQNANVLQPYHKKRSDFRLGKIKIEWFDNQELDMSRNQRGYASVVRGEDSASPSTSASDAQTLPPMGMITTVKGLSDFNYGIIHLYKDKEGVLMSKTSEGTVDALESTSSKPNTSKTTEIDTHGGTVVCVLAVPSYMSATDFLKFTAPVNQCVSHYRIIRDTAPNKYMVIMKFRDSPSSQDFYRRYNGKPFSSMEPEICHVVYIKSVEIDTSMVAPYSFPFLYETLKSDREARLLEAKDGEQTSGPADELPTCPVCLERMDANITGLLTILCQHTFHCYCLSKWGDGSCPVCRYSQKPIGVERNSSRHVIAAESAANAANGINAEDVNECFVCGATESLWICLICGHIGCGRYNDAHAYHHYMETNHLYALELETQRVWDYAGDGYVHRLIQNTIDGKLVELPGATTDDNQRVPQEKLDAVSLEYTYLLTSQLESQRMYYEDHLTSLTSQLSTLSKQVKSLAGEIQTVKAENDSLISYRREADKQFKEIEKEKEKAEKKIDVFKEKYETIRKEWQEEKEMTNSLAKNNEHLKLEMKLKDKAIVDLSDQVRDLMFFLESREKVSDNPEMEGGSVEVAPAAKGKKTKRGKR